MTHKQMSAPELKERPIIFSGPMVRAILDGRKTQTRLVITSIGNDSGFVLVDSGTGWWPYRSDDGESLFHTVKVKGREYKHDTPHNCPYGTVGDRLWVRETWAHDDEDGQLIYRADLGQVGHADDWQRNIAEGAPGYRWRPSIHMPRWASRITLEITSIRVERLQDIRASDATAEGCPGEMGTAYGMAVIVKAPQEEYRDLWDFINANRGHSWESNPWVWVIEFQPCS